MIFALISCFLLGLVEYFFFRKLNNAKTQSCAFYYKSFEMEVTRYTLSANFLPTFITRNRCSQMLRYCTSTATL